MFTTILVPLDGSHLSAKAIPYAIEIASKFDADVTLLQVVKATSPIIGVGLTGVASPSTIDMEMKIALEQDRKNTLSARRYLQRQVRRLRVKGIKGSYKTVLGTPTNSITTFCHQNHVDLVIMTTHGKSGFNRAILGSVSDAVVRQSGVPVLLIKSR